MFPGDHPSKYWLVSTLLNFSDRTRTGVFSVIWPLARAERKLKYLFKESSKFVILRAVWRWRWCTWKAMDTYVLNHQFSNKNDLYVCLRLQKNTLKSSNKKSQRTRAKCTSTLAWSSLDFFKLKKNWTPPPPPKKVRQFKKISTQTSKTGLAGLWKPCGNFSDTSARPPWKKMNTASASEKIELGQTLW